jgi:tetratricopeptide (TPR) repeat protein
MSKGLALIFFFCFCIVGLSFAETIYLKSGKVAEGKIIEKTDKYVKVDFYGVELTYWIDDIERIEGESKLISSADSAKTTTNLPRKENIEKVYYAKKYGLRFNVPQGWVLIDENNPEQFNKESAAGGTGVICILKENQSEDLPSIYVKCNFLTRVPQNITIEEYAEKALRQNNLQATYADPRLKIVEDAHVVSIEGKKVSKSVFKLVESDIENTYVYYHLLKGQACYSYVGFSSFKKLDTINSLLEAIIKTVQLDEEAPTVSQVADAKQLAKLGSDHFDTGDFDKAIEFFEQALTKDPDFNLKVALLFTLSSAYLEKGITTYTLNKDDGFYQKSLEYANKCLELKPNDWKALGNIGTVYMNLSNLEKADFYFTEAEKYADKNSPEYQQLILHHALIKKTLDAKKNK